MAARARTGFVALAVVVLAVAAIAVGARVLWNAAQSAVRSNGCDFGNYTLDLGQAEIASTVVGTVLKRGLPERAAVLTIGAALQESKLRNLAPGDGDRDSVGILQQRPSQGWGTAAQISDVRYATAKFLDAVVKVPNWQSDSLATVVQAVQVSADGEAYARHEAEAQAVSDALTGAKATGVSCSFDKPTVVASTARVAQAIQADLPVPAPAQSGRDVTVTGAGWATASWFICNADNLGIDSVRYDGQVWTRAKGWKADSGVSKAAVVATLAKL